MKYDISCKVFSIVFSKLLKSYYKTNFADVDMSKTIKEVKKEYKAMIIRTPGLSKDNHMVGNLKGAAYFFAIAKKVPDMTPELMDKIISDSFNSKFMVNLYAKKKKKGTLFSEKEQDKMYKDSIRSQSSEDEMDWKYEYHKGKGDIRYDICKCGVKRLAEREDLLNYLPCMCKMDYPKYKLQGATLDRDKTLAQGDEVCNFHLIQDKPEK